MNQTWIQVAGVPWSIHYTSYYGLNIRAPHESYVEVLFPAPHVMVLGAGAFGRWLGQESEALMNMIDALINEISESFLLLSTMWAPNEKMTIYEPGSRLSLDTESFGSLILDFQASKMMSNKWILFISRPVYGIPL